jgi:hypothetical protein
LARLCTVLYPWISGHESCNGISLSWWCEAKGIDFLFGLARNAAGGDGEVRADRRHARQPPQRPAGAFKDFRYATLDSWSRERRVIGKAEVTGDKANPRFIVTSLTPVEVDARRLYEKVYCARGEMENRIKECQQDLFADRTSAVNMRANQLRLCSDRVKSTPSRAVTVGAGVEIRFEDRLEYQLRSLTVPLSYSWIIRPASAIAPHPHRGHPSLHRRLKRRSSILMRRMSSITAPALIAVIHHPGGPGVEPPDQLAEAILRHSTDLMERFAGLVGCGGSAGRQHEDSTFEVGDNR